METVISLASTLSKLPYSDKIFGSVDVKKVVKYLCSPECTKKLVQDELDEHRILVFDNVKLYSLIACYIIRNMHLLHISQKKVIFYVNSLLDGINKSPNNMVLLTLLDPSIESDIITNMSGFSIVSILWTEILSVDLSLIEDKYTKNWVAIVKKLIYMNSRIIMQNIILNSLLCDKLIKIFGDHITSSIANNYFSSPEFSKIKANVNYIRALNFFKNNSDSYTSILKSLLKIEINNTLIEDLMKEIKYAINFLNNDRNLMRDIILFIITISSNCNNDLKFKQILDILELVLSNQNINESSVSSYNINNANYYKRERNLEIITEMIIVFSDLETNKKMVDTLHSLGFKVNTPWRFYH